MSWTLQQIHEFSIPSVRLMMLNLKFSLVHSINFEIGSSAFRLKANNHQYWLLILAKMRDKDVDKVRIPTKKHLNYSEDFHLTNVQDFGRKFSKSNVTWAKNSVHYQTWAFHSDFVRQMKKKAIFFTRLHSRVNQILWKIMWNLLEETTNNNIFWNILCVCHLMFLLFSDFLNCNCFFPFYFWQIVVCWDWLLPDKRVIFYGSIISSRHLCFFTSFNEGRRDFLSNFFIFFLLVLKLKKFLS